MPENNSSNKQYIRKKREEFIGTNSKRPTERRGGPGGHGAMVVEKPKNFKESWGKMIRYSKPQLPVENTAYLR